MKRIGKKIAFLTSLSILFNFYNVAGQLRDVYENTQFTHSYFYNPANIAVDPTINLNVGVYAFQPQSKTIEGLYNSISLMAFKSLGKNGSVGVLYDNNQNGAFIQNNFGIKYGYLVNFTEKMSLGIGGTVGLKQSRINEARITDNFDQFFNTPDPLVAEFNKRPPQLYTDLGVNFRFSGLRIQAIYYNITKDNKLANQETEVKYYGSVEYLLELERLNLNFFGGIVGYDDKVNSNKIIAGARAFYNPIGLSLFYNTQGKITVNLDIPLIKSFALDVGYLFGPYYNNPVYGEKGNISFGVKYVLFKK